MNLAFCLRYAARVLYDARLRRFRGLRGPVLATALSLVPLVVVLMVTNGMIEGITARFLEVGSYHARIYMPEEGDRSALSLKAAAVPGVRSVHPERQGIGIAYSGAARSGVTIRAVPPQLWEQDEGFRRYMRMTEGVFDLSAEDDVVLGRELARRLGVGAGDRIKLLTGRFVSGLRFLPRISTFTVRGVFSTGYQELDKVWLWINFDRGSRVLSRESSRLFLALKLDDPFVALDSVRVDLERFLAPGERFYSWQELNRAQYVSFTTTRLLLTFIMALILSVASVNISSALVMLQIEKREDIAIMKSLGLSNEETAVAFLIIGLATGFCGMLLGMTGGLALAVSINELIGFFEGVLQFFSPGRPVRLLDPAFYLERIPVRLSFVEIWAISSFAMALSAAASFFSARRAARLKPLQVIRRY